MTKKEANNLRHGLYRIYWKSGGCSLAAIGSTKNGDRWIAPTNWLIVGSTSHWKEIDRAVLLIQTYD